MIMSVFSPVLIYYWVSRWINMVQSHRIYILNSGELLSNLKSAHCSLPVLWFENLLLSGIYIFLNKTPDLPIKDIRVKVFKDGPSKICGRQPLKNLTWSILEYFDPYKDIFAKDINDVFQMWLMVVKPNITHLLNWVINNPFMSKLLLARDVTLL